ncbi:MULTISPECIES: hypothetical protein [Pseudomonas]|uniref:Uncharacterized protein n=1 Tax=Pseudomonas fulva TaxID=47880 RepID=A0A0D0J3G4_9PSED|nr:MULTISPECIES: hypothetical protein [Pseudomonas]KIQ00068.1 hypothetical protein RU08_11670 [Pseudomonas fulva]
MPESIKKSLRSLKLFKLSRPLRAASARLVIDQLGYGAMPCNQKKDSISAMKQLDVMRHAC